MLRIMLATLLFASVAMQTRGDTPSLSTYGTPGLVELPTAEVLPDGQLAFTSSTFGPYWRNSVTFQLAPRLYGTFRYTRISDGRGPGDANFDRGFDLHYLIAEETDRRPAIAIGLRDFLGTGLKSSEYLVATKNFSPRLQVSAGIGWGDIAGRGTFRNPLSLFSDRFDTRPFGTSGRGGNVETGEWFRGPAAFFGGIRYQLNDQTTLFAEYSPDVYSRRRPATGVIDISSPINFGAQYRFANGVDLKAFVIGGSNVGLQLSYNFNPGKRIYPGGRERAPIPVEDARAIARASWNQPGGNPVPVLRARLAAEGLRLEGIEQSGNRVTIRVENERWDVAAQAVGRAARAMAATLPPGVTEFAVVLQQNGLPNSRIVTLRSDLEELQYDFDGAGLILTRSRIEDAHGPDQSTRFPDTYPRFETSFTPYSAFSFFDPDNPVRLEVGAQFAASYTPSPGLRFATRLRYPLAGNIEDSQNLSNSVLPRVRTDGVLYARESDLEVNLLTAEYMFRTAPDVFGRVTAGYLEPMFGGVSAELLWYPVNSRLAFGVELAYARKRDFDQLLGFQDYSVLTGHASVYYDFGNGYLAQIDAGRYLAGDWGATFALDREFNNGFKIGAFFTLTDVSFADFGEGSFDKGVRFEVPLSWFTGRPSKTKFGETFRPIQRDGGARLIVENRLHG